MTNFEYSVAKRPAENTKGDTRLTVQLAMGLSSLFVVSNSLRLRGFRGYRDRHFRGRMTRKTLMHSPTTYSVPEISCEHCVTAITAEVSQVGDVVSVAVDVEAKTVAVVGGDSTAILQAIDEAGYDAVRLRSSAHAEQQLDDGVVRVTKWTFPPGSETGPHVHEYDYVVVPIAEGELTIEASDGTATVAQLVIGGSYQRGKGVAHNVANDGDATVAFVEIELLDP